MVFTVAGVRVEQLRRRWAAGLAVDLSAQFPVAH
jgi:hypothetical protein